MADQVLNSTCSESPLPGASLSVASPARVIHHAAAALALILAVVLVFGRTVSFRFVLWDDDINILGNEHIKAVTVENLKWMLTDFSHALRYQPLSWLGWAADHRIWAMDPRGYHLSNLALHAACAVMAYFVLRKIAREALGLQSFTRGDVFLLVVAALFWAVHPLRAEVVSWVTGRRYSQVMFFLMISYLFDSGLLMGGQSDLRVRFRQWAGYAAFAASLLTYPLALEWPFILLMLDVAAWRGREEAGKFPWKQWLRQRAPYLALSAAFVVVNLGGRYLDPGIWQAPKTLDEFPLSARFMQAAYALAIYPIEMLIPWNLSPYYPRLHELNSTEPALIVGAVFVVGVTIALALLAVRVRWPLACWCAYCILMFTKLGWTESPHFTNDRYSHLALFAASVAIFQGLRLMLNSPGATSARRNVIQVAVAAILFIFALAAFVQAGIWRDTETLMTTMIQRLGPDPFQSELQWRLGEARRIKKDYPGALEAYTQALECKPEDVRARYHRAQMLLQTGAASESAQELERVVELQDDAKTRMQLAAIYIELKQTERARVHVKRAVEMPPEDPADRDMLAQMQAHLEGSP